MHILLTGPSGFLGSALARYWTACGHELTLLARPGSCLERLGDIASSARIVRATYPREIFSAVLDAAPEVIVHTACSYGREGESPLDVMDANQRLGVSLLQATLESLPSASAPMTFLNTGTALASDVNLYALSKTQFSAWGAALAGQAPERLCFIDIRLQQMYGPGDDQSKFTTHVIEACGRNEPRLALTNGEQRRDFIHIDDVVRAYDRILDRRADFAPSDSIEVGSGEAVTIRDFVELVKRIAGASTALDFGAVPYRTNETMLCVADTTRLRSLDWRAEVSLAEGLKDIIESVALPP